MARILLLLAIVVVVLWLLASRRRSSTKPPPSQATKRNDAATPMLACAHCGVHLPQGEALTDAGGRAYCSEAHRLAGPR